MKAGPSIVIHAEDRFTGKNSRQVTPSAEDVMLSYSMRIYAALNAWLAMCLGVDSIQYSQPGSSEKTGSTGLKASSETQGELSNTPAPTLKI